MYESSAVTVEALRADSMQPPEEAATFGVVADACVQLFE